jgi:S-adenosylmethionine decarboxylase
MMPTMYEFSCWVVGDPLDTQWAVELAIKQSGHTVLGSVTHAFEPQGFTSLWLLAESHCAIHTYPEHGATYVQLSSCSAEKYQGFIDTLATLDKVQIRESISDLLHPVEN